MDAHRWKRVKDLFAAAVEQDVRSRNAFLDAVCAGDTELRAELDSLLAAHDTSKSFIETPAARQALGIEAEPRSWIGRRVGDYRIVEEVGRGGMSEVYKAVRDDDEYRKDVAIKVLRRGYDTKSLLRRFKVETQILATLDHPNIARLLDAGSTEEGLPYLVMDYIEGRPIDEYCSENELGLKERLELFRSLCGAVHYVHQHLMVHGDLKCSNVLVSAQGTVKLLDFGIARLVNPMPGLNAPDQKLTTLLAMTPEYASPEQIRGGPITTVSDVYSLGVLLYRLLTGAVPYKLRSEFSFETAKQILEHEPSPPSLMARERASSDAAGFTRQLRGDLDNIILMALEKDAAKRYSSVEAFEADIRRHLEGFPVQAHAAGYMYRMMKFAGRHKAGITAISLVAVTLIGGIVSTSWQARVAMAQRERAERHFNEVRKLANIFMFDLHTAIEDLPGSTPARQMLVENSLKYLEALSAESANEPSLQRELASAYEKVADVQGGFRTSNLGDTAGAISSYRKALAIRQPLSDADPTNRDLRRELLRNYGKLSEMLWGEGDSKGALAATRSALKLAQELAGAADATVADQRNLGSALASLGWQLTNANQFGDGMLFLRQAAALYESLLKKAPEDTDIRRMLNVAYGRIGDALLDRTDEYAEALEMHTRAYEVERHVTEADTHNTRASKLVAYSLLGMANALGHLKRPREALQKQVEAAQILRAILDADPRNEIARYDAAFGLSEASDTDITLGDLRSAEQRLMEVLKILSASNSTTQPKLTDDKVLQAVAYFRLGQTEARRAGSPSSTTAQRARYCQEAQRWFDLAHPVLSAAEANGQWHAIIYGKADQIAHEMQICRPQT